MADRVVFLDTSGIFAWINQRDPNHQAMVALPHEPGCRLVTTDYILDETLTLFMARGISHQRKRLLAMVGSSTILKVVWIGQEHFREATEWMFKYEEHPFPLQTAHLLLAWLSLAFAKWPPLMSIL
jgi:predicted nucleic acid-binding protein